MLLLLVLFLLCYVFGLFLFVGCFRGFFVGFYCCCVWGFLCAFFLLLKRNDMHKKERANYFYLDVGVFGGGFFLGGLGFLLLFLGLLLYKY